MALNKTACNEKALTTNLENDEILIIDEHGQWKVRTKLSRCTG